jgi:phosphoribosylformylglycinamidine synthase
MELARRREVEATVLGEFTSNGRFEVTYDDLDVVDLSLEFLHHGLPRALLRAKWSPPERAPADPAVLGGDADVERLLLDLMACPNLASHEDRARRYDHEVKGLSVVKPLVGVRRDVPSTATVMRGRHARPEGVVLAEGIHPLYGDIDTFAMAAACVDEGVRKVLCAGARTDRLCALDNFCWPDPIRSEKTPDGEHKLAQLVRCCQGLRQACEAFGVPLISGKDSMKNDAYLGGVKISIPPTLLVSVMGQMEDVSRALTLVPRNAGDLVFVLGPTTEELGGSELARLEGAWLGTVPRTDLVANASRYAAFVAARDAGLVRSAHATSRGGLAVALCHMAMASGLGLDCDIAEMSGELCATSALFSESTGRIVLTCAPAGRSELERLLSPHGLHALGSVEAPAGDGGWLRVRRGGQALAEVSDAKLRERFKEGLGGL